jgi:hypothetical protein
MRHIQLIGIPLEIADLMGCGIQAFDLILFFVL